MKIQSGALSRTFALASVAGALVFVANNFLTHAAHWPGPAALWSGETQLDLRAAAAASTQLLAYPLALLLIIVHVLRRNEPDQDARRLEAIAQYIAQFAFWAVLLIGVADSIVSFLRIEELDKALLPAEVAQGLALSNYRGLRIHYPLLALAALIALRQRKFSVIWLALLVVVAELVIVIARFVFSYEQPFMGDLVRFWYAALFLFAAAYTLKEDAHVRVDVLYANASPRARARANALGAILLGMPLCWVILLRGLAGENSSINSPLLHFEISQSSAGLYVKYLMAAFLLVFALSMMAQFAATLLHSSNALRQLRTGAPQEAK